jgi:DNA-binding MarR family transcriptional regulator
MGRDDDPLAEHDPGLSAPLRAVWREARDLEQQLRKALGPMVFCEWLLLETLHELVVENRDAVSQAQLAERTGLTKMAVSYWMASMDERGLIDREPSDHGRAYRIYLSRDGRNTLREYDRRLQAAGLMEARETREARAGGD